MKFHFPKKPEASTTIADTVIVQDPFGFGLTFEVRRADHEVCRAWDEQHPESGFSQIHTRGVLAQAMSGGGGRNPATLVDELASKIEQRGGGVFANDMEIGKRKLACAVIVSWGGVMSEGVELAFSPLLALEFFGFRGYAWRAKGSTELVVKTATEFEKMKETSTARSVLAKVDGKTSGVIDFAQRFDGEFRDEEGRVWVSPHTKIVDGKHVPQDFGGHPFGQGLTMFLHAESLKASAMMAKAAQDDQDAFQHMPDTDTVSGTSPEPSEPASLSEPSGASSDVPSATAE